MALLSPNALIASLLSSLATVNGESADPLHSAHAKSVLLTLHVLFPNELLPALDLLDRNLVTRLRPTARTTAPQRSHQTETHPPAQPDLTSSSPPMSQYSTVQALLQPHTNAHVANSSVAGALNQAATIREPASRTPQVSADMGLNHNDHISDEIDPAASTVYIVRSAQPAQRPHPHRQTHDRSHGTPSSNHDWNTAGPSYEVRPLAWSCSCPAFAFAAFPAPNPPLTAGVQGQRRDKAATTYSNSAAGYTASDPAMTSRSWAFGGLSSVWGGGSGGSVPMCKHLLACVLAERGGAAFEAGVAEREVEVGELAGWAAGWGDH